MKTLCILTIYNEIKFLPYKLKYCKENDLDLYVIDNISNDGSWEWLQENKIKSHRFDTNEMFDLKALQGEIISTIHKEKPNWVIYNGCDLFPLTEGSLGKKIQQIDKEGYNVISMPCTTFHNTGEKLGIPFNTYFYYTKLRNLKMIHKYNNDFFQYSGDEVEVNHEVKLYNLNGIIINYGSTKSKEEREETYKRRKKAWDAKVTHPLHGGHYRRGSETNWIWDKNKLHDIRKTKYYKFIKNANFYK